MTIKEQVISAKENGMSYSQIYNEYGVSKSTAWDWVNRKPTLTETTPIVTGYVNDNLRRIKPSKFNKTEEEILEFLDQLKPITVPVTYPKVNRELSDYAVVFSDLHFPLQCEKTISIILQTIDILKPSKIIINGDSCDILALSRYPKDILKNYNLLEERIEYQKFLSKLVEVSGGAEIFETSANHSSGGPESRWRRYLSERIPELGCLPEVMEALSYENIFLGPFKDYVKMVDYVDLNGLYVMHGTTVRKNPGSSVMGEMERFRASVMMGHVHRMGSVSMRQPAIGKRKEQQLFGYEIGCACDLNPIYASSPNWTNGFAIVALGENTFGVELVSVINGEATVATLGETLYC
jgi:hypothetical protein